MANPRVKEIAERVEPTVFDIINPSNPYTLLAKDFLVACVANLLLTQGKAALDEFPEETPAPTAPLKMPLFLFGDSPDPFFLDYFERTMEGAIHEVFQLKKLELIECLDSVLISKPRDRKLIQQGFPDPTTDRQAFEAFRAKYHDERRSSMNDLGSRAWGLAVQIRESQLRGAGVSHA